MSADARTGFVAATALHAGFQATVTLLVYPNLARVRAAHWREQHDRHSHAIVPLVGAVYAAVVASAVWLLLAGPSVLDVAAIVSSALTILVTATLAAPLHGRLTRRDDALIARLLVADRLRLGLAVLALLLALASALVAAGS